MDPVTEPVDWDTPTQVAGKWVTVERQLNRDDEAVIATIEVTSDADGPVTVEVVDAFPEEWEAADVGVHPDFVPEHFVADTDRFEFTDTVEPDDPIEVVYGVKFDSTESIQPPSPPVIERERGLENLLDAAEDPVEADGGGAGLGSPGESADSTTALGEGAEPADTPGSAEAGDEAPRDPVLPLTRSPAGAAADEDPGDRAESLLQSSGEAEPDEQADDGPLLDGSSTESDSDERADRMGYQRQPDSAAGVDPSDGSDGDESFRFDRDEVEPDGADDDLVESLAAELDSRDESDKAVAALRTALGAGTSNRDAVRLNHLQSRVEEFAAYADMLGDLIDEHGSLEAVFEAQTGRVGALEAEIEDLRAALDDADEERATLRNRLSATTERVETIDDVADDVEATREELGQLRRDHGQELDDLSNAVDALETDLDGVVDDLESQVDTLEDRVEAWDRTRERLADALVSAEPESTDPHEAA